MSLFIFDKDGTLVSRRGNLLTKRLPPTRPEHQVVRPHVVESLAALRAEGHAITIAANIGAVAFGIIDMWRAQLLVADCARKVGGVDGYRLSPYEPRARLVNSLRRRYSPYASDDTSRKPHPGMILDLMLQLGYPSSDTIVVGDEKLDRRAALAVGARFIEAAQFFEHGAPQARVPLAPAARSAS